VHTHKQVWMAAVFGIGATTLFAAAAQAQFPAVAGDDVAPSMGMFRIAVRPAFQPIMVGKPGYDAGTHRLQSPLLFDSQTTIGRSGFLTEGSVGDIVGVPVGTAGTLVKDSDMTATPAAFNAPAGQREVHTEVRKFDLTDGSGIHVRAGTTSDRPVSPGEVQSEATGANIGNPANDFPAQSFFDIFVDVDLPGLGTLINTTPLLVQNSSLAALPPKVVYIHGGSFAVPIVFRDSNPGFWSAGDVFGDLVLAGHGFNFNPGNPSDVNTFNTTMNNQQELVVAEPEPSSLAVMAIGLSVGSIWMRRRRAC
jgi:hypothetical protein